MAPHYDAAIIGTGQAGPSLANRLTQAGMKVAVIEQGRFGGTCVNNGASRPRRWWRAPMRRTSWRAPPNMAS